MAIFTDGQIIATIHNFKSNISRYIRMLEEGQYRAVIVRRYDRTVGVFITNNSGERWEERQRKKQEEREGAKRRKDEMLIAIHKAEDDADPNRARIPGPNEAEHADRA